MRAVRRHDDIENTFVCQRMRCSIGSNASGTSASGGAFHGYVLAVYFSLLDVLELTVFIICTNTEDADLSSTMEHNVDGPVSIRSQKFSFLRLPSLFPRLEPASASPERSFHSLEALSVDPETGGVYWATQPCQAQSNKPCLSSVTSVQLLRQVLDDPGLCGAGISFTLDPEDPSQPLGPYFRKNFHPAACADLWYDLLPGAVMFEADWDLKLLLHDVDGRAQGLGPWYRSIEALSRAFPPPLGAEVLGKVWLVAETLEVEESAHGIAFGKVALRMRAAAVRRDPGAPSGLAEAGPPAPALAAFVRVANQHMEELVEHVPSFQYLEQLVVAQEAARFLAARRISLPVPAGLAALRSPLSGRHRVPALHLERTRVLSYAGVVLVDRLDMSLLRLGEDVALGPGSRALLEGLPEQRGGRGRVRRFACGLRNGSTHDLQNLHQLFASNVSLECRREMSWAEHMAGERTSAEEGEREQAPEEAAEYEACPEALAFWSTEAEEWRVWASETLRKARRAPGGNGNEGRGKRVGEEEGKGEGDDGAGREEEKEVGGEEQTISEEICAEIQGVEDGKESGLGQEGEHKEEEEEEKVEGEEKVEYEAASLAETVAYNVTGRVLILGRVDWADEDDCREDPTFSKKEEGMEEEEGRVLLAMENQSGLTEAIALHEPVGVLLVQLEEMRQRRRRDTSKPKGGKEERRRGSAPRQKGVEDDGLYPTLPPGLPVRFISEDVARDIQKAECRHGVLHVWLTCGMERDLGSGQQEEEEKEGGEEEERGGKRSLVHEGALYRTLDAVLVDAEHTGCQEQDLPLPEGFEIAPASPGVVEAVVRQHRWGTSSLLLQATEGGGEGPGERLQVPPAFASLATAALFGQGGRAMETGDLVVRASEGSGPPRYRPRQCDARILIRTAVCTVSYGGYSYRVLESGVPVDLLEVPGAPAVFEGLRGLQLPEGWELSPVNRGIAQRVVGAHAWGTDALILADGKGYPTLLYFHRRSQQQKEQQRQEGEGRAPLAPHHRILIRRRDSDQGGDVAPEEAGEGEEKGGEGDLRMGDMYRADANAVLEFRRLAREGGGYLLEIEVSERVMIHGGVDLTSVRRVSRDETAAGGQWQGEGEKSVLAALGRDLARGQVGGTLWEGNGASAKRCEVFRTT